MHVVAAKDGRGHQESDALDETTTAALIGGNGNLQMPMNVEGFDQQLPVPPDISVCHVLTGASATHPPLAIRFASQHGELICGLWPRRAEGTTQVHDNSAASGRRCTMRSRDAG